MKPYPSKRYHATEPPCYVADAAADALLGPGWTDDPDTVLTVTETVIDKPCDGVQDETGAACTKPAGHRGRHVYA